MSVIACRVSFDNISFAADSQITCRSSKDNKLEYEKIQTIDNVTMGAAGWLDECILIGDYIRRHDFPNNSSDILLYMLEFYKYRDSLSETFKPQCDDEERSASSMVMMVAVDGKVFLVDNRTVLRVKSYHAIGSGDVYAQAIMAYGGDVDSAVRIACQIDLNCAEPIQHVDVPIKWSVPC